jgi:hypothetical protein
MGDDKEIPLFPVAPWAVKAKDDSPRKDVSFGPGCKFSLPAYSTPGAILPATAGSKPEDLVRSPSRLVLIDEVLLTIPQGQLLTPQSKSTPSPHLHLVDFLASLKELAPFKPSIYRLNQRLCPKPQKKLPR